MLKKYFQLLLLFLLPSLAFAEGSGLKINYKKSKGSDHFIIILGKQLL